MKQIFLLLSALLITSVVAGQSFHYITEDMSGQSITLSSNDILAVELTSNPSTGYGWYPKDLNETIIKQIKDWIFHPDKAMPGSPGIQTLIFKGISEGSAKLELLYHRPWEKDVKPLETFTININSEGAYTGNYQPATPPPRKKYDPSEDRSDRDLPSHFSWLEEGGCTSVKSQGSCGSCWAFASVIPMESNLLITDGNNTDLSEQYIVSCNYDGYGCNGGWDALKYFVDAVPSGEPEAGAVYEDDFPYSGTDESCNAPHDHYEKADSYHYPSESVATLKQIIYDYGPVWCGVCADSDMQYYNGGIFTGPGCSQTNHAIALVGWDDDDGAWQFKNQWGSGWGDNGYMWIEYGVSNIGDEPAYLIYKGGIDHSAPPVADFTAGNTTSCTGEVEFFDQSLHSVETWLWDFGDGNTSTEANPVHSYSSNGTFTVELTVTNQYGTDSETATNYITIDKPAAPSTTDGSGQSGSSVTLYASGAGTLDWYNASTGGTLVNTGTVFNTPALYETTTYHVEDVIQDQEQNVGALDNSIGSGDYFDANDVRGLFFDVFEPVIIKSVKVFSNQAGDRLIEVLDAQGGSVVTSVTVNIPNGESVIDLDLEVDPGTDYFIKATGLVNLYRNDNGADYPYQISDLVSITHSYTNDAQSDLEYYYFFYDWEVQGQACISDRTPVTATINPVNISEVGSKQGITLYPNPNNGNFNLKVQLPDKDIFVKIVNIEGKVIYLNEYSNINGELNVDLDLSMYANGIYNLRVYSGDKIFKKNFIIK